MLSFHSNIELIGDNMLLITALVLSSIKVLFLEATYKNFITSNCDECGDKCLGVIGLTLCHCGNETIRPSISKKRCCIFPDETCHLEDEIPQHVTCRNAEVKPMHLPCDNVEKSLQCYNSYPDNKYVGTLSHYTCPDICVPVNSDMCQGVSWCENDEEECGPDIRCRYDILNQYKTSLIAPDHHFCSNKATKQIVNDGKYDKLDRSDENLSISSENNLINITQFKKCQSGNEDGVMCDKECIDHNFWCLKDIKPQVPSPTLFF